MEQSNAPGDLVVGIMKYKLKDTDIFKDGKLIPNQKIDYLEWGFDRFLEAGFYSKEMEGELSSVCLKVFEGDKEIERWPVVDTIPIRPDLAFKLFWTA